MSKDMRAKIVEAMEALGVGHVCRFEDGTKIHRHGIHHEGDDPLVPMSVAVEALLPLLARACDEGYNLAVHDHTAREDGAPYCWWPTSPNPYWVALNEASTT